MFWQYKEVVSITGSHAMCATVLTARKYNRCSHKDNVSRCWRKTLRKKNPFPDSRGICSLRAFRIGQY